jgi:hypothetical protein
MSLSSVSTQAMLGQRGPTLEARSGSCLIIAIYTPRHGAGLLIHLGRDADLSDEGADLIRKPFEEYPQLAEARLRDLGVGIQSQP